MAKILDNEKATAALAKTKSAYLAASSSNLPDFDKIQAAKK
jgi:limonene 1,2-monooxygenase